MPGKAKLVPSMGAEGILRRHLLRDLNRKRRFDAAFDIDPRQLGQFGLRLFRQFAPLARGIGGFRIGSALFSMSRWSPAVNGKRKNDPGACRRTFC